MRTDALSAAGFGRLVQEKRLARGWSRARLAEAALGVASAERRIIEIEEGLVAAPATRVCDAIAVTLGITDEERSLAAARAATVVPAAAPHAVLERAYQALSGRHGSSGLSAAERRAVERQKTAAWRASRTRLAHFVRERPALRPVILAAQAEADGARFEQADALFAEAEAMLHKGPGRVELRRERGEIALIGCDPYRAWRCFEAAAEFLDPYTPHAGADLRMAAATQLHRHGRLFGPEGVEATTLLLRKAVDSWRPERHPERWATAWSNLAAALHDLALARGGAKAQALLEEAVEAYRKALDIFDRETHPGRWATTQSNLATTLGNLARRRRGSAAAALFAEAAAAHRAALKIRNRAAKPADWAAEQAELALALGSAAESAKTRAEAQRLLAESAAAGEAALGVYRKDATPGHWAAARNNLGMTLRSQAAAGGPAQLLVKAAVCFREAIAALAEEGEAGEGRRAAIRTNLALALTDLAGRASPDAAGALAAEAASAARSAYAARINAESAVKGACLSALAGALIAEAKAAHGPAAARAASEAAARLRQALADTALSADPNRAAGFSVALGRALEAEAEVSAPSERKRRLTAARQAFEDALRRLAAVGPSSLRAAAEHGVRRMEQRRAA